MVLVQLNIGIQMRWYQYGGLRRKRPGVIILDGRNSAGQSSLRMDSHPDTKTQEKKGHDRDDLDSPSASVKRSQFPGRVRGQTPCGLRPVESLGIERGVERRAQSSCVTTNLGSSAPNEANSPVWTAKASAVRPAKLPWDEVCETKPIPSRGKEKASAGAAALRNATLPSGIRKKANQEIGVPGPAAGRRKQLPRSPGIVEW
jgi:hypothetical protein